MRRTWTPGELEYLIANYAQNSSIDIAKTLGRGVASIYFRAAKLGLKKDPETIREMGRKYTQHPKAIAARFQKGRIAENKGKKMPRETYEKMQRTKTWFSKGHVPHNAYDADGVLVFKSDYWYIRLELSKWVPLHRYLWAQEYGPITSKDIIVFRDGNVHNCTLENLEKISRLELMRRNSIQRYPAETKALMRTLGQFKKKLNNARDREKNSKK